MLKKYQKNLYSRLNCFFYGFLPECFLLDDDFVRKILNHILHYSKPQLFFVAVTYVKHTEKCAD